MIAAKDRPILFSAPMVRALLAGTKTQTRRIVKYIPALGEPTEWCHGYLSHNLSDIIGDCSRYCTYGQPGDRLWVRETWCHKMDDEGIVYNKDGGMDPTCAWYRASDPDVVAMDGDGFIKSNKDGSESSAWKPSIHMPRWASRITLVITDIRVERLQDISEGDALAAGLKSMAPAFGHGWQSIAPVSGGWAHPVLAYRELWESINGPGSWDLNPWVWAVSFKVAP